ncbi:ECF subfamily RNA polymerase sigma-24 subunit [Seminavis robusta]|uniref:ECF subfamily RNA polymerase sigma-24 subunit n=1 Tax=Seminavis robusta TaxID=568900 RepID=A0A9N8H1V2_9STRA|nr:ECF subfamily RNA polymerase sigma-24 subunit [Seminavis robusta]|eukprot:Sro8_g006730.1 ECF subfamily RNA polymerase sigma-24 subunit (1089) ;mRNA; f:142638-146370
MDRDDMFQHHDALMDESHTSHTTGTHGQPSPQQPSSTSFSPTPPPGVAEMATAAANAAAAAGASAGMVVAGPAAAAGGVMGAIGAAGVATQVGVAMSVAAVTATVGVVAASSSFNSTASTGTATQEATVSRLSSFVPPKCSEESDNKVGYVELDIQAIPPDAIGPRKWVMEEMFRDVYNEIIGMCLDPMARVMLQATLVGWETQWGVAANGTSTFGNTTVLDPTAQNLTQEEYDLAVAQSVTTTYWEATVDCLGCPDHEPLFDARQDGLGSERRRNLRQYELEDFFVLFAASVGFNLVPLLQGNVTITASSSNCQSSSLRNARVTRGTTRAAQPRTSPLGDSVLGISAQNQGGSGSPLEDAGDFGGVSVVIDSQTTPPMASPSTTSQMTSITQPSSSMITNPTDDGIVFTPSSIVVLSVSLDSPVQAPFPLNPTAHGAQPNTPTIATPSLGRPTALIVGNPAALSQPSKNSDQSPAMPPSVIGFGKAHASITSEAPALQHAASGLLGPPNPLASTPQVSAPATGQPIITTVLSSALPSPTTPSVAVIGAPSKKAPTVAYSTLQAGAPTRHPSSRAVYLSAASKEAYPTSPPTSTIAPTPARTSQPTTLAMTPSHSLAPEEPTIQTDVQLANKQASQPTPLAMVPTIQPTPEPSQEPTERPTRQPTISPTDDPTNSPTPEPITDPTDDPTSSPTTAPTTAPTTSPTVSPTNDPTPEPTFAPTVSETLEPTANPTPTPVSTSDPTDNPTSATGVQTGNPSLLPSVSPSLSPSLEPSDSPSSAPTLCSSGVLVDTRSLYYVFFDSDIAALTNDTVISAFVNGYANIPHPCSVIINSITVEGRSQQRRLQESQTVLFDINSTQASGRTFLDITTDATAFLQGFNAAYSGATAFRIDTVTSSPSGSPSIIPSESFSPSISPTTGAPTASVAPSIIPSIHPSVGPSVSSSPSTSPTAIPSTAPSTTAVPSSSPTSTPSTSPGTSTSPSLTVTPGSPSLAPTTESPTTGTPTVSPGSPSLAPTTAGPTKTPTTSPPTVAPGSPSVSPTTVTPTLATTTGSPMATPGSPSLAPTTASPTTGTPTSRLGFPVPAPQL